MEVCVIGAGIIGAVTARDLASSGARVTVLDAAESARGASYATFGWINANGKQPDHYFELNRAGMAAHVELTRVLGDDSWLHRDGSIEVASGDEAATALVARVEDLARRGYPAELVDPRRLRSLEPGLQLEAGDAPAALFSSEGWVDTPALIETLLRAASDGGAALWRGVRATSVEAAAGGGARVALGDGSPLAVDVVVNCAGPDAGALARAAGLALDVAGPPGLNVVTPPLRGGPRRVVRAPGVHLRPETGGRVMIATPRADSALAAGDVNQLARENVDAAARSFPALADASVEEARVARRAIPPDGLPIVGRTAEAPWMYHVIMHSGVTLAPLVGRLAALEIVGERDEPLLAPYRPERFSASLSS